MRLILVRHGETDSNARLLLQGGQLDYPLNERGRLQARRVAARLRMERIDAAFTSDLKRARQTLDAILRHHPHLKARRRRVLRERFYGALEGKPYRQRSDAVSASGLPFHEFQPRRGESFVQVRSRLRRFTRELLKNHRNQTVLVASHGGTMAVLLLHLFDVPWSELNRFRYHPNTGVTIVDIPARGLPRLRLIRDVSHLPLELRPAGA